MPKLNLYVASSWRNDRQPAVVAELRSDHHLVYDFKNPRPGDKGFGWSEIDPAWKEWTTSGFRLALTHPCAVAGFQSDFQAMKACDGCVLVLPCGRSAHLEAGWFIGAGKPVWILVEGTIEPELMYSMADGVYQGLGELLSAIDEYVAIREHLVDPTL